MYILRFISLLLMLITCIGFAVSFYAFVIMDEKTAKIAGAITIICAILSFGIAYVADIKENNEAIQPNEVVQEGTKIAETTKTQPVQVFSEITYEPAELVECVELENGAYQMLFAVEESEVQLFSWIDTYTYPDDAPYLLTMDNKGTLNNPLDDEILVVWKDMN